MIMNIDIGKVFSETGVDEINLNINRQEPDIMILKVHLHTESNRRYTTGRALSIKKLECDVRSETDIFIDFIQQRIKQIQEGEKDHD